jgi:hypothetical protein
MWEYKIKVWHSLLLVYINYTMLQTLEPTAQVCYSILSGRCLCWLIRMDISNLTECVCVCVCVCVWFVWMLQEKLLEVWQWLQKHSKEFNTTLKSSCRTHIGIFHHFMHILSDAFNCAIYKSIHNSQNINQCFETKTHN